MLLVSGLCYASATSGDIEWCCVDLGASETHQVKRKVPGQAPERADGRCGQVGPVPSCEFPFLTLNPSQFDLKLKKHKIEIGLSELNLPFVPRNCLTSSWTRTSWKMPVSTSLTTWRPTGRPPTPPAATHRTPY